MVYCFFLLFVVELAGHLCSFDYFVHSLKIKNRNRYQDFLKKHINYLKIISNVAEYC